MSLFLVFAFLKENANFFYSQDVKYTIQKRKQCVAKPQKNKNTTNLRKKNYIREFIWFKSRTPVINIWFRGSNQLANALP